MYALVVCVVLNFALAFCIHTDTIFQSMHLLGEEIKLHFFTFSIRSAFELWGKGRNYKELEKDLKKFPVNLKVSSNSHVRL